MGSPWKSSFVDLDLANYEAGISREYDVLSSKEHAENPNEYKIVKHKTINNFSPMD